MRRSATGLAPSADRIPISAVRWLTTYDSTPWMPTHPTTSATAAATTSSDIVNVVWLIESSSTRSIDCTFAIGRSPSTSAIAPRIAVTRLTGSDAVRMVIVIACTPPPAESTIGT
ncbi:hypothetical protein D3C83_18430 [compost metagenome]